MLREGFGEIGEKLRRATVYVGVGRHGQGSGFIVKAEGLLVTNAHVATSSPILVGLWDGTRSLATLVTRDVGCDIAILRLPKSGLPSVTLADSDQVRVGELVIAVGNPLGFIGALTTGIVHSIGRLPGLGPRKWIQSDVRLAPGNSGGPLANAHGHVVGVNTMVAAGLGLAVPSSTVARYLKAPDSSSSFGIVARPIAIKKNGRERFGLMILEVAERSPAAMASLMPSDLLIGVDGKDLDSIDDFEKLLDGIGDRVIRIQFLRGDRTNVRTVAVRLRPPSRVAA
jgi:serine protease Do